MKRHERVKRMLGRREELTLTEEREVRAHLVMCPDCGQRADDYGGHEALLRPLVQHRAPVPLRARVLQLVQERSLEDAGPSVSGGSATTTIARRQLRVRRLFLSVALCVLIVLSGLTVAAAASPRFQKTLHDAILGAAPSPLQEIVWAGMGEKRESLGAVPFRVLMPGFIPPELRQHEVGHVHGGSGWMGEVLFIVPCKSKTPSSTCPHWSTEWRPNHQPDALARLEASRVEGVWLSYTAPYPESDYVDLTEQAASARAPPPTGEPIQIQGVPARIRTTKGETIVTLVISGTAVEIHTNLGRSGALEVAQGLR